MPETKLCQGEISGNVCRYPDFLALSQTILRRSKSTSRNHDRRFRAFFGVSPEVCEKLWQRLVWHIEEQPQRWIRWRTPRHRALFKTRLHSCNFVQISFAERLLQVPFLGSFASVDGTDCPIQEPDTFDSCCTAKR